MSQSDEISFTSIPRTRKELANKWGSSLSYVKDILKSNPLSELLEEAGYQVRKKISPRQLKIIHELFGGLEEE